MKHIRKYIQRWIYLDIDMESLNDKKKSDNECK